MEYFLTFLEGILTFISPCLLPMLPVYLSYFAGAEPGKPGRGRMLALFNAAGFVAGFTLVFLLLGAAAGTFGRFVHTHEFLFQLIAGGVLVVFGLNFVGAIPGGFLNRTLRLPFKVHAVNFPKSVLLGIVFSIGWTPCVGAFLGSALMLAANSQQAYKGIVMLMLFSLGLGIPFVLSAVLIDSLKQTFDALKRHYRAISLVSGLLLIIVGILMMTGRLNAFLSILTFR